MKPWIGEWVLGILAAGFSTRTIHA